MTPLPIAAAAATLSSWAYAQLDASQPHARAEVRVRVDDADLLTWLRAQPHAEKVRLPAFVIATRRPLTHSSV